MRWLTVRTDFVTQISCKRQPEDSECSQPSRHVQRPYFTLIQWETNRRRKTASPFLSVHVAPIRNDNHPAVSRPSGARRKWFLSVVSVKTGAWPDSRHKKIFQHLISHGELLQFYFYFFFYSSGFNSDTGEHWGISQHSSKRRHCQKTGLEFRSRHRKVYQHVCAWEWTERKGITPPALEATVQALCEGDHLQERVSSVVLVKMWSR